MWEEEEFPAIWMLIFKRVWKADFSIVVEVCKNNRNKKRIKIKIKEQT